MKSENQLTKSEPSYQQANQVFKWIISGATETDIADAITETFPEADQSALLLAAISKIRESAKIDPETVMGFCFEATRDLYRRMVEVQDFPGALRAIKQLRELVK